MAVTEVIGVLPELTRGGRGEAEGVEAVALLVLGPVAA